MTQTTTPSQRLTEALEELKRINTEGLDSTTVVVNLSPSEKANIELMQADWYKQNEALQALAQVMGAESVLRTGMRIVVLSNWDVDSAIEEGSKVIDWAYHSDTQVLWVDLLFDKWVVLSSARPEGTELPVVKTECSLSELVEYRTSTDKFKWFVVHENDRFF